MWLSQQSRREESGLTAGVGTVTLAGERPGVYLDGERRQAALFGPGGYCWRPRVGQQVLVIKAGEGGERPCLAGAEQEYGEELAPGEVAIYGPHGAAVRLRQDGTVDLRGQVAINGVPMEELFQRVPEEESGGGAGGTGNA